MTLICCNAYDRIFDGSLCLPYHLDLYYIPVEQNLRDIIYLLSHIMGIDGLCPHDMFCDRKEKD